MAGPWFTVQRDGDDWHELGGIWISNGKSDSQGQVEIKIEMERGNDDS